jgi:hypothetical protein
MLYTPAAMVGYFDEVALPARRVRSTERSCLRSPYGTRWRWSVPCGRATFSDECRDAKYRDGTGPLPQAPAESASTTLRSRTTC